MATIVFHMLKYRQKWFGRILIRVAPVFVVTTENVVATENVVTFARFCSSNRNCSNMSPAFVIND